MILLPSWVRHAGCVCVCVYGMCVRPLCVSLCVWVCVCVLFMCCWLYHVHICAWSQPGAIFVRQTDQVAMDEGAAADDAGAGAVGVTADKGGKGVGSRNRSRSRKRQLWSRHRDCHLPDRQAWLPTRHGALPGCLPLHVGGERKKTKSETSFSRRGAAAAAAAVAVAARPGQATVEMASSAFCWFRKLVCIRNHLSA